MGRGPDRPSRSRSPRGDAHAVADALARVEDHAVAGGEAGGDLGGVAVLVAELHAAAVGDAAGDDGDRLQSRGILYAPDYVINAGGIINVALEYLDGADRATVDAKVLQIPDRLNAVWDGSEASGQNPARVADAMAQKLIGRG